MSPTETPHYASVREDVDGSEWIEVSEHSWTRWKSRRRDGTRIGPRVAWFESIVIPRPHGLHADEVRYHDDSRTLLLRKESHLVTVIALGKAKPRARRAVEGEVGDD